MTTNRPHRARVQPVLAVLALTVGIVAMVQQHPTIARAATGDATGDVTVNVVQSNVGRKRPRRVVERTVSPLPASTSPDVSVDLDATRQSLYGLGATLTESSAALLMGLPAERRQAVLQELFDPQRTGLSVLRLVIGPSDFSLTRRPWTTRPHPRPGPDALLARPGRGLGHPGGPTDPRDQPEHPPHRQPLDRAGVDEGAGERRGLAAGNDESAE